MIIFRRLVVRILLFDVKEADLQIVLVTQDFNRDNIINHVMSKSKYYGLKWNWDCDSEEELQSFLYTVVKKHIDAFANVYRPLYSSNGNITGVGVKEYSETGNSQTNSTAEISPLNGVIGEINTPTSKGNGLNNYSRKNTLIGENDTIKNLFRYLDSGFSYVEIIYRELTKFMYNYVTIE